MEKKLAQLYNFMNANGKELGYNHELQQKFQQISMAFLRALKKELPFTECKVSFNPGGIAVSGDAHLMGMFENGIGLYITINDSCFSERKLNFLYRTISHMKDYSGGPNNYMTNEQMQNVNLLMMNIRGLCNV